jgi:hypothetical protein
VSPEDAVGSELRVVRGTIVYHSVIEDREFIYQFFHGVVSFTNAVDIIVLQELDSGVQVC